MNALDYYVTNYKKNITSHIIGSASWQKKRTFDTTYLRLLWTYWGFIFYLWANKKPAFFEGWWYTGKMIRQILAESAVCFNSYL